jgi:hypothetical protein
MKVRLSPNWRALFVMMLAFASVAAAERFGSLGASVACAEAAKDLRGKWPQDSVSERKLRSAI